MTTKHALNASAAAFFITLAAALAGCGGGDVSSATQDMSAQSASDPLLDDTGSALAKIDTEKRADTIVLQGYNVAGVLRASAQTPGDRCI
jgi:cytolysin (calcineurin-like family phosphatase)